MSPPADDARMDEQHARRLLRHTPVDVLAEIVRKVAREGLFAHERVPVTRDAPRRTAGPRHRFHPVRR